MDKNKVILIVNNDETELFIFKRILSRISNEIISAKDGHEALKVLQNQKVNLIIVRIEMPSYRGFQFIERVRSQSLKKLKHDLKIVPIIATSSSCHRASDWPDINDFILVPITTSELLEKVKKFL